MSLLVLIKMIFGVSGSLWLLRRVMIDPSFCFQSLIYLNGGFLYWRTEVLLRNPQSFCSLGSKFLLFFELANFFWTKKVQYFAYLPMWMCCSDSGLERVGTSLSTLRERSTDPSCWDVVGCFYWGSFSCSILMLCLGWGHMLIKPVSCSAFLFFGIRNWNWGSNNSCLAHSCLAENWGNLK